MKNIGFLFDLDGVIVDTAKYHFLAWKKTANKLNINFTQEHNELLKGVSRVASLEILLGIDNVKISEEEKQQILVDKNEDYLEYIGKMTAKEILPGVIMILDFLEKNNIKYALGSASKNAPFILKKVGLYERFSAIVDGNDVSKAKPDPEVFFIGAKKINVKPEKCVVFEDAIAGIDAANAAKMISIGVGDKATLNKADYVFGSLSEISESFMEKLVEETLKK
ncbi:beta-phosphoglucomutase [uncultured Maribacter sp.]|uniref:beta-phosphoglucomutase n=1 Tax=uncultured Maribacter sp. TaxID=431308 RepID=UPI00262D5F87|nr:beta-phosphoglucomutase [uncultured Maribacter sp.]